MPRTLLPIKNFDRPVHPSTPLGDHRERAVPCTSCRRETWNVCGCCNMHCAHASGAPSSSS